KLPISPAHHPSLIKHGTTVCFTLISNSSTRPFLQKMKVRAGEKRRNRSSRCPEVIEDSLSASCQPETWGSISHSLLPAGFGTILPSNFAKGRILWEKVGLP
ncbi:hypothetical protein H1C71_042052, partial [Ictidomys tridecemlineatus]